MKDTDQIGLAKLREPFAQNQIGQLPKPYKRDSAKGNCTVCGGYHGLPAMHLDYVGHAALTHRLLDVDPEWSWEPLAVGPDGLPAFDKLGGLWIKLTVLGVTRLGYGDADGKTGSSAIKEVIGDALRNAGMRFGIALDLWHKGDLHADKFDRDENPRPAASVQEPPAPMSAEDKAFAEADAERLSQAIEKAETKADLTQIGQEIAGSRTVQGDARDALRKAFSAKMQALPS